VNEARKQWAAVGQPLKASAAGSRQDAAPSVVSEPVALATRQPMPAPQNLVKVPLTQKLPSIADARDGRGGSFPLSELGNAARFCALFGGDVRFVPELGAWLVWRDGHWTWDTDGSQTRQLVADLVADIYDDVIGNPDEGELFLKWARTSSKSQTIRNVHGLVKDIQAIRVSIQDLDADHMVIGLAGGRLALDLETGRSRPADKRDYITKAAASDSLGHPAEAQRWLKFLDEIFQGDSELIDWLKRFMGYALTGRTDEQFFVFFYGHGANGKSVLITAMNKLWGDYVRTIQPETLMQQKRASAEASPDLARLAGARLVAGSETEDGQRLSEVTIKTLTGGDRITARNLHKDSFEFQPCMKLMLAGNHLPQINGTDHSIWRRVRAVPFGRTFKKEEQDNGLDAALWSERAHILAWMAEGTKEWLTRGLRDVPTAISKTTDEYRLSEDLVGAWISERTMAWGTTAAASLYADYKVWAANGGTKPMSNQAFGRQMTHRQFKKIRDRTGIIYSDISLCASGADLHPYDYRSEPAATAFTAAEMDDHVPF
jgi:P4 family phage/plasmid primase-like protien